MTGNRNFVRFAHSQSKVTDKITKQKKVKSYWCKNESVNTANFSIYFICIPNINLYTILEVIIASACQHFIYEWAKRPKFLFAVIYGSPRKHSSSSKTFKKNREKFKFIFMTILGLAESFKTKNRPGPARPVPTARLFDGLFLGSYKRKERKILKQSLFKSSIYAFKIRDRYLS